MDNVINPHEVGQIIIDKDKKLIVPNAGEALDGPRDNTIWVRVDIEHDQVLAWWPNIFLFFGGDSSITTKKWWLSI